MSLEAISTRTRHDAAWDPLGHHLVQLVPVADRDDVADRRTCELFTRMLDATPQERQLIRDEIVTLHLWLADNAARRYGPRSEQDDLVQVARVGLIEAFDRYDPSKASYPSFAWATVTGLLRRHLRDHGWAVRPPRSTQEAATTLSATVPDLAQTLGRAPSTADLAACLSWTPESVTAARRAQLSLRAISVEAMTGDGWMPGSPAESNAVEARVLLGRAARDLSQPERDLLRMRFVEEMSQSQIAALIGVTQMQVSRLLARLMAKLRAKIGELDEPRPSRQTHASRRPCCGRQPNVQPPVPVEDGPSPDVSGRGGAGG